VPEVEKNPLINELQAMKRRMDMLYSERFAEQEANKSDTQMDVATWEPFMDIWESEEEWLVVADLPGVPDEDLHVEVLQNKLTISGQRKAVPPGKGLEVSKAERPEGQFSRTFMLPANALQEKIQAECKRGVLTVKIPKNHGVHASHHRVIVHSE